MKNESTQKKQREGDLHLILNDKAFNLSRNFKCIKDINHDISLSLLENNEYKIQSKVSDDIFQSFIHYLTTKEIPDINIDNLIEYKELSNEFNIIEDIIFIVDSIKRSVSKKEEKIRQKTPILNQIIKTVLNSPIIQSKTHFSTIAHNLKLACKNEDIETVNFLIQNPIQINGLTYLLNEKVLTASIFETDLKNDILIPRSITHESKEYIITKIIELSTRNKNINKIISIKFAPDSEIKSIEDRSMSSIQIKNISIPPQVTKIGKYAFSWCRKLETIKIPKNSELTTISKGVFDYTKIDHLQIPPKLTALEDGWCMNTQKLNNLSISTDNNRYFYYDDNFIIGKSELNRNEYDTLIFSRRNIEYVKIPSFIEFISPFAFEYCENLNEIQFSDDSKLISIGQSAFSESSIEKVKIPKNVTVIGKSSFMNSKLNSIEFVENSKLTSIGEFAFFKSFLKTIFIPAGVTEICNFTFSQCRNLECIEFSENSMLTSIGNNAFSETSIEKIKIPKNVTKIHSNAFVGCEKLAKISFDENSDMSLKEQEKVIKTVQNEHKFFY